MDGAIFHFQEIQNEYPLFWTVLIFTIGLIESKGISSLWDQGFGGESTGIAGIREDVICGNLGLDPLGIVANEDEEKFLVSRHLLTRLVLVVWTRRSVGTMDSKVSDLLLF
jgi:hypothetical protein